MSDDKLRRMANQIADFFEPYPDDQAVAGVHDHIAAFWTPKMRARLDAQIAHDASGLNRLVVAAMRPRPTARSPADKEAAGPGPGGPDRRQRRGLTLVTTDDRLR